MALVDLKSNLSWYSAKGIPRGYKPNADKQSTDFVYNDDLTVSARPKGYANNGIAEMYPTLTTANEFQIDNNSKSFRGTARRMNQLGEGTKFPIGPLGQVHKFDLPRLGFNPVTKYEEVYGPLTNSGLADTYTLESPIDDMYNKFKVRDEAFNRGIIREPFILRGIQRDDNSDPQRFIGSNSPADIPRGGLLTATERSAIDVARISKFLLTPKGINFITKQSTLALMNPNVEGADGEAQGKKDKAQSIHINSTKLFTPGNTLAQIGSAFTGLHVRKLGLGPVDIQDTILNSPPMEYEKILTVTRAEQGDLTADNRLVLIYRDLIRDSAGDYLPDLYTKGTAIPQLTAGLGPTALSFDGSIGDTTIRRWSVTIPSKTAKIAIGDETGKARTDLTFEEYQKGRYGYSDDGSKGYIAKLENDISPLEQFITNDDGFKSRMLTVITPIVYESVYEQTSISNNIFYDDITKGNELRKEAGPGRSKLVDFRAYTNFEGKLIHDNFEPYAKDDDTSFAKGQETGRNESIPSLLREDATEDSGLIFDGLGRSDRAKAENRPSVPGQSGDPEGGIVPNDPLTGRFLTSDGKTATPIKTADYYQVLGKTAEARKASPTSKPFEWRGRQSKDGLNPLKEMEGGGLKLQEDPSEELMVQRINQSGFDGIQNPGTQTTKPVLNPALPKDAPATIAKYMTLAYDDIRSAADTMSNGTILYGRKKWSSPNDKHGIFWSKALEKIDTTLKGYNTQMEDGELITFKFNGITFKAYIDNISDNFSPGFSPEPDQNRADPRYLYTTFERKVQISFRVVYEKTNEDPWGKLKSLADLSLPRYGDGPWAQQVDVTIGSLYKNTPMLIESISYDWDNETPWSLKGDQADTHNGLPMYTQVQLGLIYMGNVKAAAGSGYVAYG
jgi:hypothetical protein